MLILYNSIESASALSQAVSEAKVKSRIPLHYHKQKNNHLLLAGIVGGYSFELNIF